MSLPFILKSPRHSPWKTLYKCKICTELYSPTDFVVVTASRCRSCGSPHVEKTQARAVHYTYLHRLALFLAGYPQPQPHIEFKADQ